MSDQDRLLFILDFLRYKVGFEVITRIYRRDLIEENDLRFLDTNRIFAEDVCFNLCYLGHVNRVVSISDVFYFYRQHVESIMSRARTCFNANKMNELCKCVFEYYCSHHVDAILLNSFPIISYLVMDNVIERYQHIYSPSLQEMRVEIVNDIEDLNFYCDNMKRIAAFGYEMSRIFPPLDAGVRIATAEYYADGNMVKLKMKLFANSVNFRVKAAWRKIAAGFTVSQSS